MKRYKNIFILLVLLLLLFVSCDEKNASTHDPLNGRTEIKDSSLDVYIPPTTYGDISVGAIKIVNGEQVGEVKVTTKRADGEVSQSDLQGMIYKPFKDALYDNSIDGIHISECGVLSDRNSFSDRTFIYRFNAYTGYTFRHDKGGMANFRDTIVRFTLDNCILVERYSSK